MLDYLMTAEDGKAVRLAAAMEELSTRSSTKT